MDEIAVRQMREQTIYAVRSNMTRDDACQMIVPSDLRLLIGAIDAKDNRIAELEAALKPFAAVAGVGAPRMKIDPAIDRLWSYYDNRAEVQYEITRAHVNEAARAYNSH